MYLPNHHLHEPRKIIHNQQTTPAHLLYNKLHEKRVCIRKGTLMFDGLFV